MLTFDDTLPPESDTDPISSSGPDGNEVRAPSSDDVGGSPSRRRRFGQWHQPTRSGWIAAAIGVFTAVLYSWNLDAVGNANSYYTAAVKSASVSWKAWFYGSIDPGSFITVDKPPAAFWVQGLAARIFGFGTFSMILPEILAGVASVLILHHLVRKWKGDTAAHLAALVLAVTPIAAAMFRNNNPDAFLTFLGVAAAWAMWRALDSGRTRFLVVAAALSGLAFDTKMLQAFLVLPAFIVVYLIAGPPKIGTRLLQLLASLAALVVAGGWWIAVVTLVPSASRPFIGSTQDNSIITLVFGYNGLDRVFGSGNGNGGGTFPGGGAGFGGSPGWFRLFNGEAGGLISWLIPMAVFGLVAGLWLTRRNKRTDLDRAGWILWGATALTCLAVFSLSAGTFHPYYTVQLAPSIAALAGAAGVTLWKLGRRHVEMMWALPLAIGVTAYWAVQLLHRTTNYFTWLPTAITVGAALGIVGIVSGHLLKNRHLVIGAGAIAAITLLAGPTAFAMTTVQHPVIGSLVSAGPASAAGQGGFGGLRGGPGDAGAPDVALIDYLLANRGTARYIVAGSGSGSTESIIIAAGAPVMTIGGFSGGDPAPTLAQFKTLVANGTVRYYVAGGGGFVGGRSNSGIAQWAASVGKVVSINGYNGTLYDLQGAS